MSHSRDCGDAATGTVEDELGYDFRLVVESHHDPTQGGYDYDEVPRIGDNRWYLHGHYVEDRPSSSDQSDWCSVSTTKLEYKGKVNDDDRTQLEYYYPRGSNEEDSKSYSASVGAGISYGPFSVGAGISIGGSFPNSISLDKQWSDESYFSPWWKFKYPNIPAANEEYSNSETYQGGDWARWDTKTSMEAGNYERIYAWARNSYKIYVQSSCRRGGDWIYVTSPWAGVNAYYKSV